MTMPPTQPMIAMMQIVCVTFATLGCVRMTTKDLSRYHLILPVIPSLTATLHHPPLKRLRLLMMTGTKRPRMLVMTRTRATRQTRHPSHQALQSIYDMIPLARTFSSPAGTMSAAQKVMRMSLS